jgi:hypothetical protein
MGMNRFEWNGQPAKVVPVLVVLRGAGAAAPLVVCGPGGEPVTPTAGASIAGVQVSRTAEGDYTLTFAEKPGRLVGFSWGFASTAPAAVGTGTALTPILDSDSMTATGQSLRLFLINPATDAAAANVEDLEATEELTLIFYFRQCGKGM